MKQCPACGTLYTDDSLRYCLADGSVLETADEEPTVFVPQHEPLRVPVQSAAASARKNPGVSANSWRRWLKILAVIVILGALGLAAIGLAGGIYYFNSANKPPVAAKKPEPTPMATAEPTPDPDYQRLQDELAKLERLLEEQKKAPASEPPSPEDGNEERGSSITATVDSPNDGFLALRDAPDAKTGRRLAKIPNEAEVEIQNCEKRQVTIGGRTGRWCQVTYGGLTGWVFDAWLKY